jgi:hypothetical protein
LCTLHQVTEAAKQIGLLNLRLEEAAQRRAAAEADTEAARKEVGVLRQAVSQSSSMEQQQQQLQSGQSDEQQQQQQQHQSVSGTAQSASLAATSEAKLRTLHNKVYMYKALCSSIHRYGIGQRLVVLVWTRSVLQTIAAASAIVTDVVTSIL